MAITLYQFEISPFCDKVRRALHVKRLDYEVREVSMAETVTDLKRKNPAGKVPFIEDGDRTIADSTEIVRWLEEKHPSPPLLPSAPRERALCHLLEDWADESLYFYEIRLRFTFPNNAKKWIPILTARENAVVRSAAGLLVPQVMKKVLANQGLGRKTDEAIVGDVRRHVRALASWLGEADWLVGDALSIADIAVFAQLHCIRGTDEGARILDDDRVVSTWMDRVDAATARAPRAG
jgi:glutathione S-transferase